MEQNDQSGLTKRRITLKDGRYMIFYTFEGDAVPPSLEDQRNERSGPEPDPQSKDARGV